MPVLDENGRVFRVVNVVDLLVALLTVAVVAAASALLLPGSVAGVLVVGIGLVSLGGLVFLSRRRFDVSWSEVRSAMRPNLSVPTLGGIKRWFTADPDPDVVVIDLRETITVAPFIVALDRIVGLVAGVYRGSWLEAAIGRVRRGVLAAPVRIASIGLLAFVAVDAVADVFLNVELFVAPIGTDGGPFEWGARVVVLVVLLLGASVGLSWAELRETRVVGGIAAALAPPEPPTEPRSEDRAFSPETGGPQREQDSGPAESPGDREREMVASDADDAAGADGGQEDPQQADAR
jgi:hypothetical protein